VKGRGLLSPLIATAYFSLFLPLQKSSQQTSIEKQQEKMIASLEAKLSRKNEVLSEVMEEHVRLKKSLGEI